MTEGETVMARQATGDDMRQAMIGAGDEGEVRVRRRTVRRCAGDDDDDDDDGDDDAMTDDDDGWMRQDDGV